MTSGMEGDEGAKTEAQSQKETTAHSSLKHQRAEISCIPHHFHSYLCTTTIKARLYLKNQSTHQTCYLPYVSAEIMPFFLYLSKTSLYI